MPPLSSTKRGGRHEVGAEADRADEAVLDPQQRNLVALGRCGQPRGHARGPDCNRSARPPPRRSERARRGAAKRRRPGGRAQKIGDPATLPERHPDQHRDPPIGSLDLPPVGQDRQGRLERGRGVSKRVEMAGRDQTSPGKDLVDRARERMPRDPRRVGGDAPAGIKAILEAAHRPPGEQREKAGFAPRGIDPLGPGERRPRVDRPGDDAGPALRGHGQQTAAGDAVGRQDHDLVCGVLGQCRRQHRAQHRGGRRAAGSARVDERDAFAWRQLASPPPRSADLPRDQLAPRRRGPFEETRRLPISACQHAGRRQDVGRRARPVDRHRGHTQHRSGALAPRRRSQQAISQNDRRHPECRGPRPPPFLLPRARPGGNPGERPRIRKIGEQRRRRGSVERAGADLQSPPASRRDPGAAIVGGNLRRGEIRLRHVSK